MKLLEAIDKLDTYFLNESSGIIRCYRSIGKNELFALLDGETIKGRYDNSTEKQNNSDMKNIVCFFKDRYRWKDASHEWVIECEFNLDEISQGSGQYFASKDLDKTRTWSGRRGSVEYNLNEIYVREYSLSNVKAFLVDDPNAISSDSIRKGNLFIRFNDDCQKELYEILDQHNIPIEKF